jgi:phosphate transport system protein
MRFMRHAGGPPHNMARARRRRGNVKEHFAEQLEELRRNLILMGGEVERQIQRSIEALTEVDPEKARAVIQADEEIDRFEVAIEEQAVALLALQQPVAVDLRFLVAALKINSDLERIGDHAVNIAEGAERLSAQKPFKPFIDIAFMADVAMSMLKQALDAFVHRDADLAKTVIRRDDILDEKNVSLIRELLTYMAENPTLITYCIELISISKNLERVGDLATNICEDTIFIAEARWVKHHATQIG